MTRIDDYKELLKLRNLKATPGRMELLRVLDASPTPLSITDMQHELKKLKLDQATFYRMVNDLKEASVIREVHLEHNHAHYELGGDHHHHAICEQCGKIVDLSSCNIAGLETEVLKKAKFKSINRHSLEFFGLCNACAKK